jgi:hypothetical protein
MRSSRRFFRAWSFSTRPIPTAQRAAGSCRRPGQRAEGANLSVAGVYHDEYVRDPGRSDAAIARWFTSLVYLYYFR